jgi:predicted site-specific integrase-resolvase
MMTEFHTLMEVARKLEVGYWRIKHAHAAGHIPCPPLIGGRYLYSKEDVARVRDHFENKRTRKDKE